MLNSPLPGYVRYEDNGVLNINEALEQVFTNCNADSVHREEYKNPREPFRQYSINITGKKFKLRYLPKGAHDSLWITYTKNDLLDAITSHLNSSQVKEVPAVINDIIRGHHSAYIREVLDGSFSDNYTVSLGMRYSVYCTEQIAYADPVRIKLQEIVLPWLAGCSSNDVNHKICDCWKVRPESPVMKTQVYSKIPALITSGDVNPWYRPFYNRLIKRYMPNAQLLMLHNRGHAPGYTVDEVDYVEQFFEHPFKKLVSQSRNLVIE